MTAQMTAEQLRDRIKQLEEQVRRLQRERDHLKQTCPLVNPYAGGDCEQVEEIRRLNEEITKLRKEMREIARRLSRYEDVTGRYLLPVEPDD